MAEVIGLVSGLITLSAAGFKLCQTLSFLAASIGPVEHDVKMIAAEIKATSEILELTKESLNNSSETRSRIVKEGRAILPGLTHQCELCFGRIEELIDFLKPYTARSRRRASGTEVVKYGDESRASRLLSKMKWEKHKPEVHRLRGYLEALKSNIQLLVSVLRHEVASERNAPKVIRSVNITPLLVRSSSPPEVKHSVTRSLEH